MLERADVRAALGESFPAVEAAMKDYLARRAGRQEIVFHADLKIDDKGRMPNVHVDPVSGVFQGILDYGLMLKGAPEEAFLGLCNDRDFARVVCDAYTKRGGRIEWRDVAARGVAEQLIRLSRALAASDAPAADVARYALLRDLPETAPRRARALTPRHEA
jgi:hypothetical protein